MYYKTAASLQPVAELVNEAAQAVNDPTRTTVDSSISDALEGTAHAAAAAVHSTSLGSLTAAPLLATAGGVAAAGLAAGALALAGPAIALAGVGVGALAAAGDRQLREEKVKLLKAAQDRRQALSPLLSARQTLPRERADYLLGLDHLLLDAIGHLQEDLT